MAEFARRWSSVGAGAIASLIWGDTAAFSRPPGAYRTSSPTMGNPSQFTGSYLSRSVSRHRKLGAVDQDPGLVGRVVLIPKPIPSTNHISQCVSECSHRGDAQWEFQGLSISPCWVDVWVAEGG